MSVLKNDGSGGSSVIWALRHGAEHTLRASAAILKVDSARLIFSAFFPKGQHLRIKGLSDLFLDTPLYNAHSTASDMLWAQVCVCVCVCVYVCVCVSVCVCVCLCVCV